MNAFKLPLMAAFLIGLAVACGKPEPDPGHGQTTPSQPQVVAVSSVSLDKTSVSLNVGESVTLAATVKPDNATNKTVSWSSSNASVASVDASGKVSAVAEGTATITAKAGDKTATCSVTVTKKVVAVESVTLDKSSLELNEGETATLTATVKPDNASDKTVTWSSSKTSVATVDANGKVTAVAEGNATITAKAGNKSATCSVTVTKNVVAVESITLDKSSLELNEGETATLVATVKPDNATNKTVTWSSNKASVATVDASGKVTAVAEGSATITAKAGDKTATCTVTVKKNVVAVESVTLDITSTILNTGETLTLTATVKPDNATDKTVTWSSNKTAFATVDANGKVTAVAEGTAIITAKAGDKTATCTVMVMKTDIPVESITLDKYYLELTEGETGNIIATVKPDNATNKTVTWSSSNPTIAAVDQNGEVTAVKEGTAIITAKAGDKTATCTVTVKKSVVAVESVTLDITSTILNTGETLTLTATVKPDNATDKTVTWSSSNPTIAAVDQNGTVTAVAEGTATITAKASDKSATCTVMVMKTDIPVESITLDKYYLQLTEGEIGTITATVKPDNATNKTVTWSSSNPTIAVVDLNGTVTAIAEGTAAITAKAGGWTATCMVYVMKTNIPVESITLDKYYLELTEGETGTITATVKPDNATNKTVTWSSSNPTIAAVDQNGEVTAIKEGTVTITAKAGAWTASCMVCVKKKSTSVSGDIEDFKNENGEW